MPKASNRLPDTFYEVSDANCLWYEDADGNVLDIRLATRALGRTHRMNLGSYGQQKHTVVRIEKGDDGEG